jgi:hypothetical protein
VRSVFRGRGRHPHVKVLMLTHDFPPQTLGGEGVFASAIATRLYARGVDIEVVAPRTTGDTAHDEKLEFKVHRVDVVKANFATRTLSFAWSSRHLVRSYQGDVVYAATDAESLPRHACRPIASSSLVRTVSRFTSARTVCAA